MALIYINVYKSLEVKVRMSKRPSYVRRVIRNLVGLGGLVAGTFSVGGCPSLGEVYKLAFPGVDLESVSLPAENDGKRTMDVYEEDVKVPVDQRPLDNQGRIIGTADFRVVPQEPKKWQDPVDRTSVEVRPYDGQNGETNPMTLETRAISGTDGSYYMRVIFGDNGDVAYRGGSHWTAVLGANGFVFDGIGEKTTLDLVYHPGHSPEWLTRQLENLVNNNSQQNSSNGNGNKNDNTGVNNFNYNAAVNDNSANGNDNAAALTPYVEFVANDGFTPVDQMGVGWARIQALIPTSLEPSMGYGISDFRVEELGDNPRIEIAEVLPFVRAGPRGGFAVYEGLVRTKYIGSQATDQTNQELLQVRINTPVGEITDSSYVNSSLPNNLVPQGAELN